MKSDKESKKVLAKMKARRSGLEAGKLGHEGGGPMKEEHVHKDSAESAEKSNPGKGKPEFVKEGSHLDHPRVKAIKQHKLVNDTAYFLHHPQIKPHGPSMPPKKPAGK